jgi:acyl-CoA thioester hydrolase
MSAADKIIDLRAALSSVRYGIVAIENTRLHSMPVDVTEEDIDFMGHVNNASYLKWVQVAVLSHWRQIAPTEAVNELLWVALRHDITYRRPTFLGDDVVAAVLLEKIEGARAFYRTVISRGEDVLAEVKSSWCCVNAQTLRPVRLARDVADLFLGRARLA